ncbi:sigma-54 dependent transcriptional regulator [Mucilaginibacter sp. SMC90]|uniref:sigma-54-dependent transcriptional regulator n=1 Tax=Mucilaginibacter sp. SMC90 TaxID=2929803 RepID=UPI001FB38AF5|nr:sigma-54 dependent transcriptional regulator [Mucilaginibacter sp. SMC90]UOE49215.1 sigma-54 dependent transcriptional regulator [Mucilaginibacter sp. SMC90]
MMKIKLLIVDNPVTEVNRLKIILKNTGYLVSQIAGSVQEGLTLMAHDNPNLVLLDAGIAETPNGLNFADILTKKKIAFVYLSPDASKLILSIAKPNSAYGILVKPFRKKDVLIMLDVATYVHRQKTLKPRIAVALSSTPQQRVFENIIGKSQTFLDALKKANMAGLSNMPILIQGESGTGKELIARAIHELSARKAGPLIVINCATLAPGLVEPEMYGYEKNPFNGMPEQRIGKLEQANGGTILLDEIAELPITFQAKFVRGLLEQKVKPIGGKKRIINVRVIAITNHKLEDEIQRGRFRIDLYYYLNITPIALPSLRNRKEDISLLAKYFVALFANKANKQIIGLSDDALISLNNHLWPGNVRELKNLMERCVLLANSTVINSVFPPADKDSLH